MRPSVRSFARVLIPAKCFSQLNAKHLGPSVESYYTYSFIIIVIIVIIIITALFVSYSNIFVSGTGYALRIHVYIIYSTALDN